MSITKKNTLFILDWDDTLFPTSWIIKNNINMTTFFFNDDKFIILDNTLVAFLTTILSLGDVIIITNALPEWIELSSKIIPQSRSILSNIKIISAKQQFYNTSSNAMDWKKYAFLNEDLSKYKNIISIGDAQYEYQALINLSKYTKNIFLKSIRFIPYQYSDYLLEQSFNIIIDQIQTLKESIQYITTLPRHSDMVFKTFV